MKRLISLLLCALMLMPLIACSDTVQSSDEPQNTPSETTVPGESELQQSETTRLEPALPDSDFGGYEFRVLTKGTSMTHWESKDITAAELNGDPINDAVYERNSKIGELYNFTIVEIPVADYYNQGAEATVSIQAGSDDYDMLCLKPEGVLSGLINKGFLYDLDEVQYMDLTKPWYDANAISSLSLLGKTYIVMGDMLTMDNDAIGAIFFNKGIAADLQLPDMYSAVKDGTWTFDVLTEYANKAARDLDGDSKMTPENDMWGAETEWCLSACMAAGCGLSVISKDENDSPYVTIMDDRYVSMLEKVYKLQTNRDVVLYADSITGYTDVWTECMDVVFKNNQSLFNCAWLNRASLFREMDTDFGILPYPKYDTAQEGYHCYVSMYCSNSVSIPKTISDSDRTGIIIEALSAESTYTLLPAYYDKTLKTKLSRDEDSSDMLDIIFDSTLYCLGYMFNWGSVNSIVNDIGATAGADASGLASKVASAEKAIGKTMSKTLEAIEGN